MIRTHRNLPPIVSGYPLEQGTKSWFSAIKPVQRTNEITNPSAELATITGYTAGAGTLTTTTTYQYHGARSFQYTPAASVNDGFYWSSLSTTSGQTRAISCKFRGAAGVPYALTLATSGGIDLITKPFVATGRWQWIWLYHTETSSTTRRIYFRKNNSASTAPFYVDGVQSEVITAGETASTYIDGDQQGLLPNQYPPAYYWNGTPHASTSTRTALTRAGGMVVPFNTYGFLLTAIVGLGLAGVQNTATEYARVDGGYADYTRKPTRQFTVSGRIQAPTPQQLDRYRSGLGALLDRDANPLDQPLVLRYEKLDARDQAVSEPGLIHAKYVGGLEGQADNLYAEAAPISFTQYLPIIFGEAEEAAALSVQQSVSNANYALLRSPSGTWSAMGTGLNDEVLAIQYANDQYVYVGGSFGSASGVASTEAIARYDLNTATWSAMGSGGPAGAIVYDMALAPNGDIYVGGDFASMGGAATSQRAARWNVSSGTWTGLNYPGATYVRCMAIGPSGSIYTGSLDGTTRQWNGSSWTTLGTASGFNADIYDVAIGPDGYLYAAGSFTSPNGVVSATNIARYTLGSASPAWEALTGGDPGGTIISGIAWVNGKLYAATGTSPSLAVWNGSHWSDLDGLNGLAVGVTPRPDGTLVVFGLFTQINGATSPDSIAIWNGGSFAPLDADLPGTPGSTIINIARSRIDGTLIVGGSFTGTATVVATTTITVSGTAHTYPTITLKGPSSGTARIYSITNNTTGRAIYLNLTLNAGETVTLVMQPDALSVTSDFQGNVAGTILPGSSAADFFLQPGANIIGVLSSGSTVTATMRWHPAYTALDGLTR